MRIKKPGVYLAVVRQDVFSRPSREVPILGFSCDYAYTVDRQGHPDFFETDGFQANGYWQIVTRLGDIDVSNLSQQQLDRMPD